MVKIVACLALAWAGGAVLADGCGVEPDGRAAGCATVDLPVVQDVDVFVAGGGVGAVSAACAAQAAGARVFLAAPRPPAGR